MSAAWACGSVTEPIDETPIGVFSGQRSAALAELDDSNRAAKQRLQQVFFPKRLQFEDGESRNPNWAFFSSTCERIASLIPVW